MPQLLISLWIPSIVMIFLIFMMSLKFFKFMVKSYNFYNNND